MICHEQHLYLRHGEIERREIDIESTGEVDEADADVVEKVF